MDDVADAARPVPAIHEIVTESWGKALGIAPGPDDRLLDVLANDDPGLNQSYQIGLLLADIAAATSVHLPLTIVYASPTTAELVQMVRAPEPPRHVRPVLMKPGAGNGLFMFPGLGGIGLDVLRLIRRLSFAGPIYFNPPRGLDGVEPDHTLDDVVADHITCIRRVQPNGPYWLLGSSWGGLVALEIARVLRAAGENIAFVGMIDPILSQSDWTVSAWLQYVRVRLGYHVKELRQTRSPITAIRYAGRRVVPVIDKLLRPFGITRLWPLAKAGDELPPPLAAVWSAESVLIKQYRLHRYDGPVTLFATRFGHASEVDPRKIWPSKVGRFDLVWTPGDHELTEPGVADTARVISDTLAQVRG
jgi:pimeloyl-ACP methyl ester carboxylesterase